MVRREVRASILPAGVKGLGAFASEFIAAHSFVCSYEGEALNRREFRRRYARSDPIYAFRLSKSTIIDGRNSSHYSRYINHDENGNLRARISSSRIEFYALRAIMTSEELTYDYGPNYWIGRDVQPAAGTDGRALVDGFSSDTSTSLPHKLPPRTPLSAKEASIALSLPREAAVAWLQSRCQVRGQCASDRTEVFKLPLTVDLPRMQRRMIRRALALLSWPAASPHAGTLVSRWRAHDEVPALHARDRTFLQSRWAEALSLWASVGTRPLVYMYTPSAAEQRERWRGDNCCVFNNRRGNNGLSRTPLAPHAARPSAAECMYRY